MSVYAASGDAGVRHAEAWSWPTGRTMPLCGATFVYVMRTSEKRPNCKRCARIKRARKAGRR